MAMPAVTKIAAKTNPHVHHRCGVIARRIPVSVARCRAIAIRWRHDAASKSERKSEDDEKSGHGISPDGRCMEHWRRITGALFGSKCFVELH